MPHVMEHTFPAHLPRLAGLAVVSFLLLAAGAVLQGAAAQTSPACNSADPRQVRLQVSVSGMRTGEGSMNITIYPDDAEHFLDGKYKLDRKIVPVTLPVTHACFVVGHPGYYAVAMYHDENNDGHMNTNLLGIPTEGYGFSNNPKLRLGPPSLNQVRFAAQAGDNPVAVTLNH